jgi:PAS domain S-box-containing protein
MSQKPIELILMRQLASSLVMPIFLVDPSGTLVYYNEAAEQILGVRFDETGEMPASEWTTRWQPSDADGAQLVPERLPLMVALQQSRPAHGELWIQGIDGRRRHIQVTAIPLVAVSDRLLGAAAIFWEDPS